MRGEGPKIGCETFKALGGSKIVLIALHTAFCALRGVCGKKVAKRGSTFAKLKKSRAKLLRNRLASEALRRNEPPSQGHCNDAVLS